MSESLVARERTLGLAAEPAPRGGLKARLALGWEVVAGGFVELLAPKVR